MKGAFSKKILGIINAMTAYSGGACGVVGANPDPLTSAQLLYACQHIDVVNKSLDGWKEKTIDYLISSQGIDGHWERENDTWHVSTTAWVLMSLADIREFVPIKVIDGALRWLVEQEVASGGFGESADIKISNSYATTCACSALAKVGNLCRIVDRNIRWLSSYQKQTGGFYDAIAIQGHEEASLTAYVCHGLEHIDSSCSNCIKRRAAEFIARSQRQSGAWTTWFDDSDTVEGTAACLRVMKSYPLYSEQSEKAKIFLKSIIGKISIDYWTAVSLAYVMDFIDNDSR